MSQLRPAHLIVKTVLFDPGQPIASVYFPIDGVISLVTPLADGNIVEVATIGNEGIVGVPLVAGGSLAVRAISQVGGRTLRMDAPSLRQRSSSASPGFRSLVQRYVQALFGQISAGGGLQPPALQRGAPQPLVAHEPRPRRHGHLPNHSRVPRADARIPPRDRDAVGRACSRPPASSEYHRGRVTIVDREGLEAVSCECYGIIKAGPGPGGVGPN